MDVEPDWLVWAREIQAIAQTGLTFTENPYDRERYEALRALSARIFAARTNALTERIETLFEGETGYATPKIDVRAAVFDESDRLLMVREVADQHRWTLPGGWADVNLTTAENAIKEVVEESGYRVMVTKLAALWDRTRQGHPNGVFSCAKVFFLCDLLDGEATTSLETSEVGWFAQGCVPNDLSVGRVTSMQISRMFDHRRNPELAADFE